jgi:hypothetical protein
MTDEAGVSDSVNVVQSREPTKEELAEYHAKMAELEARDVAKAQARGREPIKIHIVPDDTVDPVLWNQLRWEIAETVANLVAAHGIAFKVEAAEDVETHSGDSFVIDSSAKTTEASDEDMKPFPGEFPATDSQGMYRSAKYPGRAS